MIKHAWVAAGLFAMLASPNAASAQEPAVRAQIARFRDSLRAITDTGVLRTVERAQQAAVRAHRSDAASYVRLAFVQLRRGDLRQDRGGFSNAEGNFDHAATLHPDWPLAFHGRGLARLNLADNETTARKLIPSFIVGNPIDDAADDFVTSARLDPRYTEGMLQLASIALRYRHSAQLQAALRAFRGIAGNPVGRDPQILLARARVELGIGSPDSAHAAAAAVLALVADQPTALIEEGRADLAAMVDGSALGSRSLPGADEWYRGIALADDSTARYYRADLVQVLPDSILQKYDAARGGARRDVLRSFFEFHDPGSMGTSSERLAEHYRRLERARTLFVIHAEVYCGDVALPFDPTGHEFDERGIVWVLHGPPTNRTYLNFTGGPRNESWQYKRPDGKEFLFHFVKTDEAVGYRRVSSLLDILALSKAARSTGNDNVKEKTAAGEAVETYGAGWTASVAQDILYSRENTSPVYAKMLSQGKNGAAALQAAERATGDSSIAHGETSTLRYELPLVAAIDAIAIGTDTGGTTLQVAFAIPGSSLYSPAGVSPAVYPVRTRLRVVRRDGIELSLDTVRNFVSPHPLADGDVLYGRFPLKVPPGEYQIFVAVESRGNGLVLPPRTVRIAASASPTVDLSDLALGTRSVTLRWQTARGDSVWFNPLHQFHAKEPLQLYFEVLGLPAGTPYKAALAVLKPGDTRPQVQLGFNVTAAGSPDPMHREVDLSRLGTGPYVLRLTLTTSTGQSITRSREFTVIK